jgi:RNA polymerase sigma-70 factor, ECF subfamily
MADQELIEQILAGNQQAFRLLVEQHQQRIFSTCFGILHNTSEAEDIVQEVFTEVFQSIQSFRKEARLSTWLYRIAINKSLNQLEKNKRKYNWFSLDSFFGGHKHDNLEVSEQDSRDTDALEKDEMARILHLAIDKLPHNQRIAFILGKYDELSYKEISSIMNITLPAVESLIHRAKANLQKSLAGYYSGRL